jgi:nucleoside-diphosphate-sugar epimerase
MRVLVTGTDGFIGAQMGCYLKDRGHDVVGLDTGFYRDGWIYDSPPESLTKIRQDTRRVTEEMLRGFDAVVHLAELSNDPLGQRDPALTYRINHQASVELARKSKQAGVARFVYSSSCSVYGLGSDDFRTEESDPNPQTAYAECKVLVERDVRPLADETFAPTFMRNATTYGPSPRLRFDVVLNNLCGHAWTAKRIVLSSDGTPWRPLVHVLDICQAFARVLEAPAEVVSGQILNVGDNQQNYRVREIAEIVAAAFPGCDLTFGPSDADNRSYRASFDKIHSLLPGFRCCYDAEQGVKQLHDLFEQVNLTREDFEFRAYTRLKQLDYLIATGQIDDELFWRAQ